MRMYVGSVYLFIKAVYIRFFSAYHAVVRLWMIFRLAESGKQFCASCFRKLWKTEDFCVSVYGKHAGKPLFFSIWWRKYGKNVLPFCLFLEVMAVRPVCGVRKSRLVSFQYGWKRLPGLSFCTWADARESHKTDGCFPVGRIRDSYGDGNGILSGRIKECWVIKSYFWSSECKDGHE